MHFNHRWFQQLLPGLCVSSAHPTEQPLEPLTAEMCMTQSSAAPPRAPGSCKAAGFVQHWGEKWEKLGAECLLGAAASGPLVEEVG